MLVAYDPTNQMQPIGLMNLVAPDPVFAAKPMWLMNLEDNTPELSNLDFRNIKTPMLNNLDKKAM